MLSSKVDFSYEENIKNNRKLNLLNTDTSEKKINYHYNVESGNFEKNIYFVSVRDKISLSLFAQSDGGCIVKITLNNVLIFNKTFNSYVFVNEYILTEDVNNLKIEITPNSGSIKNINISLVGKLDIKFDKKSMFFKENLIMFFNGKNCTYNTFSDFCKHICDNNSIVYDNNYDILCNYSTSNQKPENFINLYSNNNVLYFSESSTEKVVTIASGVSDSCFIPIATNKGTIVYLKDGRVCMGVVSNDYSYVSYGVIDDLQSLNITNLFSIKSLTPLNKFIAIGDGNVYLISINDALSELKYELLFSGDNVNAFYHNSKLYVFSSEVSGVTLYCFSLADTCNKTSEIFYPNFDYGFVYLGDVYLVRGSFVRKVVNE